MSPVKHRQTDAETDSRRELLFIAYEFPPSAGGGVQRLTKFARYLRKYGWSLRVVSAEPIIGRPRDESLCKQVDGIAVARLPARFIAGAIATVLRPLKRWVLKILGRHAPGASSSGASTTVEGRRPMSGRISRWLAVPDDAVLWAREVPAVSERLYAEKPFSAILASGPPYSALIAAVRAGRQLDVPVIADLRDPWSGNVHAKWPTPLHQRRFHTLERMVMKHVHSVTAVSDVIANEALEYGAPHAIVIPNGFDPSDMPVWEPDPFTSLTFVFLGKLSPRLADPGVFFAGVAMARAADPALNDVRVEIIGPDAPWAERAALDAGVADVVKFHGFKPYREALQMVSRADVGLILLVDTPGTAGIFSGKIFDYLGIGIPILLNGPEHGAAADLIRSAGCGSVVAHGDVEAVAEEITRMARAKAAGEPLCSPSAAERAVYDRREQVRLLSEVLEKAVGINDAR